MAVDHTQEPVGGARPEGLAAAPEPDQLTVHFEPKVDLRTARVIGVEAVPGRTHPSRSADSATAPLDQVESHDRIRRLTEQMVDLSTHAAADWWRSGLQLQLSINFPESAISMPDWDLPGFVEGARGAAGLPAEALQFEFTESALLADPGRVTKVVDQLSGLGADISVDDFGIGHFSMRQLLRLRVGELKIHRSIISGLVDDDQESRMIARSSIHLAHQLGIQVVAVGVETEEAWRQLRRMGCERAQGPLVSKPLRSRDVPAWLASWNQRARELNSTKLIKRRRRTALKPSGAAAEATA